MRTRDILAAARRDGAEAGRNAASWCTDGNTTLETYRAILRGIEDGDPAVLDAYRVPDLSGEYADAPTPSDLAERYGREIAEETEEEKTEDSRLEEEQAANEAEPAAPPWLAALSADLQPLGQALESAMNAGDEPAMRAALKKLSARMPDFLQATGLEAAIQAQLTQALSEP